MPRLSRPPGRLAAAPPRLGYADRASAERARDRERARLPERKLYNSKRWKDLRLEILARDGWLCRQTGVQLTETPNLPHSAVVDHIEPHKGSLPLFWDPDNLQAVAKAWHDADKQRLERRLERDGRGGRQPAATERGD